MCVYLERFAENNYKKKNKKEIRVEKVVKRKGSKLYVKWKSFDNPFNSFPESKFSLERVKVEFNLSNYAIKADLKNAAGAKKS